MTRSDDPQAAGGEGLSPDDARLLDLLAEEGFDPMRASGLEGADRARAEHIAALLTLLDADAAEPGDDLLVVATLARIDRHERAREDRLRLEAERDRVAGWRRFRLPDFISVAAVLLILASIAWPALTSVKRRSMDLTCSNNLRHLGEAFALYAADHDGATPMMTAGLPLSWDAFRNVEHLRPLVEGGYCDAGHLDCPGHHDHHAGDLPISYSYQWQQPGPRPALGSSSRVAVILGDRNPLIDAAREGQALSGATISLSHGGRGQFVLQEDGAVHWLVEPVLPGGDHIWLPEGATILRRGVAPSARGDSFLAH